MGKPAAGLIAIGGLVVAVILFVVLQGGGEGGDAGPTATTSIPAEQSAGGEGGEEPQRGSQPERKPAEPPAVSIVVENGQPRGGPSEITVTKGEEIRIDVSSDIEEQLHLHGYDVAKPIAAGGKAEFRVPATLEGVFELELENSAVPLAEISVVPQ